jgi:hypothetical protein
MRLLAGLILIFSVAAAGSQRPVFDYLKVRGQTVESTHGLKYRLKVDKSFKLLGEYHHQPTYDEKLFNVSVVAFVNRDRLIMVHAEEHADGSGGLDYSNLKPDPLGPISFTSREQCAVLAQIPNPDSIPDIKFLRESGFSPSPALFLKQFLIASKDGSAEYVLTYGERVASCGSEAITPEFKARLEGAARAAMKIRDR